MRRHMPELDVLLCHAAMASDLSLAMSCCIPGLEAYKTNSGGDMFHIPNVARAAVAQILIITSTMQFVLPCSSRYRAFSSAQCISYPNADYT